MSLFSADWNLQDVIVRSIIFAILLFTAFRATRYRLGRRSAMALGILFGIFGALALPATILQTFNFALIALLIGILALTYLGEQKGRIR